MERWGEIKKDREMEREMKKEREREMEKEMEKERERDGGRDREKHDYCDDDHSHHPATTLMWMQCDALHVD